MIPFHATINEFPTTSTMNLSELTTRTAWIRCIDPDAEFAVAGDAFWIVFCGDALEIIALADAGAFTGIDAMVDGAWVTWDAASADQRSDATLFRYILIAD